MTSLLLVSPLVYKGKSARSNLVDLPYAVPGWLGPRLWWSLSKDDWEKDVWVGRIIVLGKGLRRQFRR